MSICNEQYYLSGQLEWWSSLALSLNTVDVLHPSPFQDCEQFSVLHVCPLGVRITATKIESNTYITDKISHKNVTQKESFSVPVYR